MSNLRLLALSAGAILLCATAASNAFTAASHGVRVTVTWSNKITMVPGEPGPKYPVTSIASGMVTVSGDNVAQSIASLDQFDVPLAKSVTVWVNGRSDGCGAVTRSVFLPNTAPAPPYIVLVTILTQKGCMPMALVFYPERKARTWRYRSAPAYGAALTSIQRYSPITWLSQFKIKTIRELKLPSAPGPWNVWLTSGEKDGKLTTIVLDFRDTADRYHVIIRPGEMYKLGSQSGRRVALYDSP